MANDSRQERLLMRQRGAGSRQINNIDFGFAFTTPSQLRRSRTRSRTPQTASRSVRQSTKTPKETNRVYLQGASASIQSTRSVRSVRSTAYTEPTQRSEQPPPKRRRLSEISNLTSVASIDQPYNLERLRSIEDIDEDDLDEPPQPYIQEQDEPLEMTTQIMPDQNGEDKENDTSTLSFDRPTYKRRKRKSIGQQRPKRKRESLKQLAPNVSSVIYPESPAAEHSPEHTVQVGGANGNVEDLAENVGTRSENTTRIDSLPLPITHPQEIQVSTGEQHVSKRQKRRKSILFTRKKRRQTDTKAQTSASVDRAFEAHYRSKTLPSRNHERTPDSDSDSDSGFEDEQRNPEEEANNTHEFLRNIQTNKLREEQIQHYSGDSEDSDQDYQPDEASPKPTPAPTRKNTVVKAQQRKPSDGETRTDDVHKSKTRTKSTVPVLTHRITNLGDLPTIQEVSETEGADQSDDLAMHQTFTTRETPNAIDVLAQICRETVDSAIHTLQKQSQAGSIPKGQLKQNAVALDEFRSQLETRLFDVSQSLDQRLQLEARLRKSKREKALVQNQWLDIRKRRDKIALRIDAVRRQHWQNEVIGQRAWEASEAARALEVEVQRSEDVDMDEEPDTGQRLEIMLRNVVGDVSSFNGQGVLQKLKSFNAQLEKFTGSCETL